MRNEAEQFFALVDSDEAWQAPTGAGHWQVRDIVGHLVDTTEAHFVAFDAARSHSQVDPPYGLPGWPNASTGRHKRSGPRRARSWSSG